MLARDAAWAGLGPWILGLLLALSGAAEGTAQGGPATAGALVGSPPAAPVHRLVSLNPSLTAILVALGADDRLVGIDDYSARLQPGLAALPRVGGLYNPSLEAVVGLEPDLVVLVPSAEQRGFRAQLAALGIPQLALDPRGFDDVLETILTLGRAVGREPAARERVERIRAVRERVETATRGLPRVPTVLVLQRDPIFLIGRGSFVDDMLSSVGARNLGAQLEGAYPRVAREWLLRQAPELLIDSARDPEPAARYWARWPSLPAVAHGRVVSIGEGLVTLPGPDLDRALLALVEIVHPGALASGGTAGGERGEASGGGEGRTAGGVAAESAGGAVSSRTRSQKREEAPGAPRRAAHTLAAIARTRSRDGNPQCWPHLAPGAGA